MDKWDKRFLEMAKLVSSWSKDHTKVGSVIVDKNNRVVSVGYNGFPTGIEDDPQKYSDRDLKLKMVLHAEENAILFSNTKLKDCTIYVYPFMPCSNCCVKIIQTGIKRVVSYDYSPPAWKDIFELSKNLFDEANVDVILYEDKRGDENG